MILLDPLATPLIAHRGASGDYPENTMVAFEQGLVRGADALELDVRLSADGVPVVIHDAQVNRTTGAKGPVNSYSANALADLDAGSGEPVPSFAQVLETFPDVPLIVEIKEVGAAAPVAAVIRRHGAQGRVLVGSFEHAALRAFAGTEIARSASRRETTWFWLASRVRATLPGAYQAFTVPVQHGRLTVVDRAFVLAAKARRKPVHVWTVDVPAEAVRLRELGVAGIITNVPGQMRDLQSRRAPRTSGDRPR